MTTKRTPKTETVATEPVREPCLCNCGGTPKGKNARYLPGHDARHASALKKAEATK